MEINVLFTAQEAAHHDFTNETVVVIDVLRATTVIITALAHGADNVIAINTPDEAIALQQFLGDDMLLGGERNAEKIPGFDFDNSPLSYECEHLVGKTLIMTTTNGTLAINNAQKAKRLLIGAFVNLSAVAESIKNDLKVTLLCSGNDGYFTMEDTLCATTIIEQLKSLCDELTLSDAAIFCDSFNPLNKESLLKLAAQGKHYKTLINKGYDADIERCFTFDKYDIVPIYKDACLKV